VKKEAADGSCSKKPVNFTLTFGPVIAKVVISMLIYESLLSLIANKE